MKIKGESDQRETHKAHHYIPVFLLKHWHGGKDDRLTVFTWRNDALTVSSRRAKAVAKITGLYALGAASPTVRNVIEKTVFQTIDNDGAEVHQHLLHQGAQGLSEEQAQTWARFLVSLLVRSPQTLEKHLADSPQVLLNTMRKNALPGEDAEEVFAQLSVERPHLTRNLTLGAIVKVLEGGMVQSVVMDSVWATIDLSRSPIDLVRACPELCVRGI